MRSIKYVSDYYFNKNLCDKIFIAIFDQNWEHREQNKYLKLIEIPATIIIFEDNLLWLYLPLSLTAHTGNVK